MSGFGEFIIEVVIQGIGEWLIDVFGSKKQRQMEKVVWKGTFAEAEERDNAYWAAQTPEYRLKTLLDIREMLYPDASPRMEKVAFIRKWGDEEEE